MDIKVGEYVRTDYGEIHKVVHVVEDDGDWNYYRYENTMGDFQMSITKHSKQLIDLIECGDFVNGKLIHKIDKGSNYCYLYYGNCKTYVDYQIKTILTKESYMANCYKVGGEDEKI